MQLKSLAKEGVTRMRNLRLLTVAALALLTLLLLAPATPAKAQEPRYLHALADLRAARGWVESDHHPGFGDERHHAIDEINRAIDEVKKAARDDGKNANFTPPPQSGGDPRTPLRSAGRLLDEAYSDVKYGMDIPENAGLQARAMQHISAARQTIINIINAQW
jgi:hypothetical protein